MHYGFIALLDSGIGGISVLKELVNRFPNESFLYFGDNVNAPYGNRNKYDILSLVMKNIDKIKRYPLKAIVLACNTLSVNLISEIKEYSGVPVFGVFPPVERCLIKGQKTLLLATKKTAEQYMGIKGLDTLGMLDLALSIEQNIFSPNKVNFEKSLTFSSIGSCNNQKGYYDNVILGCTHYNFIKKQIFDHFLPKNLIDGTNNTVNMLYKFLKNTKSLEKIKRFQDLFIGNSAIENKMFFKTSG